MNHQCRYWQCPEYNHGQCFGGGCSLNPMPAPSEPSEPDAEDGDND